jgi:hypothetical protein
MEEFLTGELGEEEGTVTARAQDLLEQLASTQFGTEGERPDPAELAKTALRTLHLPEIAALRSILVPEIAVWSATEEELLAGRADAAGYEDGKASVVLDWKSDVQPSANERAQHLGQLKEYMAVMGANRGAVVYMSLGEIAWI